jgi:hypothetical protein
MPGLSGSRGSQPPFGAWAQDVEACELDAIDQQRLALVHRDRQGDRVLLFVQLRVERGDFGVGIAAVRIVRLDAAKVGVEHGPIEVAFAAPGNPTAGVRAQHRGHLRGAECLGALNLEAGDLDARLGGSRDGPGIWSRRERRGCLGWHRCGCLRVNQ